MVVLIVAITAMVILAWPARDTMVDVMRRGVRPSTAASYAASPFPSVRAAIRPSPMRDNDAIADPPTILMTNLELLTLQTYVRGVGLYIEWGSGGSTSLVAPLAKMAVSIDNNREWCQKIASRSDVEWWQVNNALKLICVDTGKVAVHWVVFLAVSDLYATTLLCPLQGQQSSLVNLRPQQTRHYFRCTPPPSTTQWLPWHRDRRVLWPAAP
jgi:hypothetical protein